MKYKLLRGVAFRIIFTLVGVGLLIRTINGYGITKIVSEFELDLKSLIVLVLSFIPTLFCYSFSWFLATDHRKMNGDLSYFRKLLLFMRMSLASIAWNNLTPFLKIGGEPLKYLMLQKYLPDKRAFESTVNYNIIHLISTGLSFIFSFVLIFVFFDYSRIFLFYVLIAFFLMFLVSLICFFTFRRRIVLFAFVFRFKLVRVLKVNLQLSLRKFKLLYLKQKKYFFISLFFDFFARFLEGLTFFFGFIFIKHPISLLSSSLLDIGRTMADTFFFFIPYQVGSREAGVRFYMEKILMINSTGFISVVLFYRLVEIFWIAFGYMLWLTTSKSFKESRV